MVFTSKMNFLLICFVCVIFVQASIGYFITHPETQFVELGTNVTLNCRFSNETALILFEHNNSIIPNADSDTFSFTYALENATLLLKNIIPIHSGTYICRAILNATFHIISNPAIVTIAKASIILAPPSISSNHISLDSPNIFTAGSEISIPFTISGNPEPTFEIVRLREVNGMLVTNGAANQIVFQWDSERPGVLLIRAPIPDLSGWYRVVANNQFGRKEFDFNITFREPEDYGISEIQRHPEIDYYSAGNRLTLSCVTRQQNVIGSWFRLANNGNLVVNIPNTSTRLAGGNVSLLFHNLSRSDTGNYVCRLTSGVNGLIVEERRIEVRVFEDLSDKVPTQMAQPEIRYGDTWIVLEWTEPNSLKPITKYHLNIIVESTDELRVQSIEKDLAPELGFYNQSQLTFLPLGYLHIIDIAASNQFGKGIASEPIYLRVNNTTPLNVLDWAPYVGGGLAVIFLVVCVFWGLCYLICFRRYMARMRKNVFERSEKMTDLEMKDNTSPTKIRRYNDEPSGYIVTNLPPSYEVARNGIQLQDVTEETHYTVSYRATIESIPGKLEHGAFAKVKMLKGNGTNMDLRDLVGEMELMATIGCHPNIIGFLGACTLEPLYVITEYFPFGDLLSYLRASRAHHVSNSIMSPARMPYFNAAPSLTPADLLSFAMQTANGMKYLASKHVIHSKLSATNVMVGEDKMIKIGNYGQYRRTTPIDTPVRHNLVDNDDVMVKWCAPESYFEKIYSHKSDVWSFGILLWEIVTVGATPYPGVRSTELYTSLATGYRMEKPLQCPQELYMLMLDTWMAHPDQRPGFQEIHERINRIIRHSALGGELSSSGTSLAESTERKFRL